MSGEAPASSVPAAVVSTSDDEALAERLRREYHQQYTTLVRMHLSFALHLNTDDDALSDKSKLKRWGLSGFGSKKAKSRGIMDGVPLTQEGICQVYQLIEFLRKDQNICQEGIFRRTGSLSRQQELRNLLNQGITLNFEGSTYSVHDCASVLKGFLSDLPEPLLTEAHYTAYCQIAELCGAADDSNSDREARLLLALQLLLLLLPPENRVLLRDLLSLLRWTATNEPTNKMSPGSLATLFTPHLVCPRNLSAETLHVSYVSLANVLAFMISHAEDVFRLPENLAVDIRAFFANRERKRVMRQQNGEAGGSSSSAPINESISDQNAASTVFRFVDIERTARENEANPTETALAQLYAHIQGLPESAKKRKLVKQFNRENGHGTPLQVLRSGVPPGSQKRGLGDSIKRHLFRKGLKGRGAQGGLLHFRASSEDLLNSPNRTPTRHRLFCTKNADTSDPVGEAATNDCLAATSADSTSASKKRRLSSSEIATHATPTKTQTIGGCEDDESNDDSDSAEECDAPISIGNRGGRRRRLYGNNVNRHLATENDAVNSSATQLRRTASEPDLSHNGDIDDDDEDDLLVAMMISAVKGDTTRHLTTSTPAVSGSSKGHVAGAGEHQNGTEPASALLAVGGHLTGDGELDRKSMSPITRSTQGMSRAMQETMMTPRSRKPVLLISGTNINKLAHQQHHHPMSDLQEEDSCNEPTPGCPTNRRTTFTPPVTTSTIANTSLTQSLTQTFRDYLHSRSLLSPTDLSFSSHTDDYDSTHNLDVDDLSASKMSVSMRRIMDGESPAVPSLPPDLLAGVSCSRRASSTKVNGSTNDVGYQYYDDEGDGDGEESGPEKEPVLKPSQFDENGRTIVYETSF